MPTPEIRQATLADLDTLVPLFDAYRQFYRQPSDPDRARDFLRARFGHNESVVFLAFLDGVARGFTQLYPSFTSTGLARTFILNDLYVAPEARRTGVATTLLTAAADYARSVGAVRLSLSTEHTNYAAQGLYEGEGWVRDSVFCSFQLPLLDA